MMDEPASNRFPKSVRLLQSYQFEQVFAHRCRSADACCSVHGRPNNLGHPRLGLVVSKKVSRKAVHRNAIKRTIRESFRLDLNRFAGLDVVVVARAPSVDAGMPALRHSLTRHWQRIEKRCAH